MREIATSTSAKKPSGATFYIDSSPFAVGRSFDCSQLSLPESKIGDWPMVYILSGDGKAYVGQTTSIYRRMKQHTENPERRCFDTATVIYNDEFNASVITDYEHRLISLMSSDGRYQLTNKNEGMTSSSYFSKSEYERMFRDLWENLRHEDEHHIRLADHTLQEIEDSEVFKYSPYKELTEEQALALEEILAAIERGLDDAEPIVVEGKPGTGKTVLATCLLKILRDDERYKNLNIRILEPVNSICSTMQKAVGSVAGLSSQDVIRAGDLIKPQYGYDPAKDKSFDILLVDETHRLRKRQNLINYTSFDHVNEVLGLPYGSTELDWVLDQARLPVLFYDPRQDVGPSCIGSEVMRKKLKPSVMANPIQLKTQMRVKGGDVYLDYIQAILDTGHPVPRRFDGYEFVFHDDFEDFYGSFEAKLQEHELTRMLSGWAWEWKTRPGSKKASEYSYDIEFDSRKLRWNSSTDNWVPKGTADPEVAHEVGCIHCIQGYDLSYSYVIIADDIRLDPATGKLEGNRDGYWDARGKNTTTQDELTEYIKKVYYVLLTRGIYGTHVYVCQPELREYFREYFV